MKFYFVFSFMLNFTQSVFSDSIIFYGDCFFFLWCCVILFFVFSHNQQSYVNVLEACNWRILCECMCSVRVQISHIWRSCDSFHITAVYLLLLLLLFWYHQNERTKNRMYGAKAKSIRLVRSFISYRYQLIWK